MGIDAGKPILDLDLRADGLRQLLRQLHPDRHPADCLADRRHQLLHHGDPALRQPDRVQAHDACRLRARSVRSLRPHRLPRREGAGQRRLVGREGAGARRDRRHRLDDLRPVHQRLQQSADHRRRADVDPRGLVAARPVDLRTRRSPTASSPAARSSAPVPRWGRDWRSPASARPAPRLAAGGLGAAGGAIAGTARAGASVAGGATAAYRGGRPCRRRGGRRFGRRQSAPPRGVEPAQQFRGRAAGPSTGGGEPGGCERSEPGRDLRTASLGPADEAQPDHQPRRLRRRPCRALRRSSQRRTAASISRKENSPCSDGPPSVTARRPTRRRPISEPARSGTSASVRPASRRRTGGSPSSACSCSSGGLAGGLVWQSARGTVDALGGAGRQARPGASGGAGRRRLSPHRSADRLASRPLHRRGARAFRPIPWCSGRTGSTPTTTSQTKARSR